MKAIFVLVLLLYCSRLWSQELPKTGALAVPDKEEVFNACDLQAEFPGGHKALVKFLAENIRYPARLTDICVSGKVYVQFVVSAEGKVVAPEIKRGIPSCPECDEEVMRVVKLLPDFIPAKVNGKPVNSYFNSPVKF
ncbi:MAG: energy transducer TonB [Fluviicola sp.]|nr:energy transducer TonB [Fluviicola sp.]